MSDDLLLYQLEIGPMQNFVYIIASKSSRTAVVVDPAWHIDTIIDHAKDHDLKITHALITHYHPDHTGGFYAGMTIPGVANLLSKNPVKVVVNKHEAEGLKKVTGLSESDLMRVEGGDTLTIGEQEIKFIHTPGHTPGSQCFLVSNRLVSGDTLFIGGCGRVDLPGADPDKMYESLNTLSKLPEETILFPGHSYGGMQSTIGQEKKTNHYLKIKTKADWMKLRVG